MNKLIFFSSVLIFSIAVSSFTSKKPLVPDDEKYKVIKVNGQIKNKKSGKDLIQGDEFLSNTPLDFKSPEARAAVISPTKGRFVLTASNKTNNGSNLVPAMNSVATRSGAMLNLIDLQNAFVDNYVIINEVRLKIGKEAYPMDDNRFFYIEYEWNGEVIPKMVSFSNDTLIIKRDDLFTIDGKSVENPFNITLNLYYRIDDKNENHKISTFSAVFPQEKELKEEVTIILTELEKKKDKEKLTEVLSYINEFYGKPDKDNLKLWLADNFKINVKD